MSPPIAHWTLRRPRTAPPRAGRRGGPHRRAREPGNSLYKCFGEKERRASPRRRRARERRGNAHTGLPRHKRPPHTHCVMDMEGERGRRSTCDLGSWGWAPRDVDEHGVSHIEPYSYVVVVKP